MQLYEILEEARQEISDPTRLYRNGWAPDADKINDFDVFMELGAVCSVTAVIRTCVRHGILRNEMSELGDGKHECNCEDCDAYSTGTTLDEVLQDIKHPALALLNQAAKELFPEADDVIDINDQPLTYTHVELLSVFDRAIELAHQQAAA